MIIKITPDEKSNAGVGLLSRKLADAELVFTDGALEGLRLLGFAVFERPGGTRSVVFPSRQYSVNGERRAFSLLRPNGGETKAQDRVRALVLQAYEEFEAQAALATL